MLPANLCFNCMASTLRNGVCPRCGHRMQDRDERSAAALPEGFRLGHLTLGRVLGSGGYGITYLAWDDSRNCRVALKELFPGGAVQRSGRSGALTLRTDFSNAEGYFRHVQQRFREEALTMRNLSVHPEIVQVYEQFDALGTSYYTMEFLEGEDLKRLAGRHGRMTWRQLEKPIFDVLKALQILHAYNLIHRDISPDNIFLQQNGRAKLIDFGSVRWERADHFTAIMKQDFAPFEQHLADGNQGPWTDTYALCATMYALMCGKLPARSGDRRFALELKKPDPLVPVEDWKPDAPAHVREAIMRGLRILPQERFQSAEEMLHALYGGSSFPAEQTHEQRGEKPAMGEGTILCVRGIYEGRRFPLPVNETVRLGRGEEGENRIAYPMRTPGISRKQCAFYRDEQGKCYVQDLQSSYGTRLNGEMIQPLSWYRLTPEVLVTVGGESYRIMG